MTAKKPHKPTKAKIVAAIKKMTVWEVKELVKALETEFELRRTP